MRKSEASPKEHKTDAISEALSSGSHADGRSGLAGHFAFQVDLWFRIMNQTY